MYQDLVDISIKIRKISLQLGSPISTPEVIVVGSQSSGKSSVLENILKRDFLPRGTGIVTKVPIRIQLTNSGKPNSLPFVIFQHQPKKIFYDFEEVHSEILKETQERTSNGAIVDDPICLNLNAPDVPNIILVDLPGLTKNAVKDQKEDVPLQIELLVKKYLKNKNCIILTISESTQEIVNSVSIKLSKEYDQKGERTLNVLTKLDLMERGTDVCDILNGEVIKNGKGFIPVINRSQKELKRGITYQQLIKKEKHFFQNHPSYCDISDKCGNEYLIKTISKLLAEKIQKSIPTLKNETEKLLLKVKKSLSSYENPFEITEGSKSGMMMLIFTKYVKEYSKLIEGNSNQCSNPKKLIGGARIYHSLQTKFTNIILKIKSNNKVKIEEIRKLLRNHSGYRSYLFNPEICFEILVKKKIEQFIKPSQNCVYLIYNELLSIFDSIKCNELQFFPQLKLEIKAVTKKFLKTLIKPTQNYIEQLILVEMSCIDLSNHNFFVDEKININLINKNKNAKKSRKRKPQRKGNDNSYISKNKNGQSNEELKDLETMPKEIKSLSKMNQNEEYIINLIQNLVKNRLNVITVKIVDSVIKTIVHFIINKSKTDLLFELVQNLYSEEKVSILLKESNTIIQQRENAKQMFQQLNNAKILLSDIAKQFF
ncbi:dynamin related protein [Anaeramoeba flamelloides]|uniref:Dynamin related protein n=1 Tax=Anaeramoeba flamelloides TaxID=1746091 RepID=A0ABQ8X5R9_9EUKA|nr:dynamin related protein [Anaeramoeba flamelloides]